MLGGLAPQPPPPLGGGCPIETLDFSEISRHLWQFPSKNQAFWPAGLLACCCLLLTAACHGPNNHQHSNMLGGLAPQPPPPLGGGCPIETLDFSEISRHLWQFPSKNQAFCPAGLLLLAAHCCLPWPKQPPTFKNVGGLGPPATTPLGGGCPIET